MFCTDFNLRNMSVQDKQNWNVFDGLVNIYRNHCGSSTCAYTWNHLNAHAHEPGTRPVNLILTSWGPINFTMVVLFSCPIPFYWPVLITSLFFWISLIFSLIFTYPILFTFYLISTLSVSIFYPSYFLVFFISSFVTISTANEPTMKIILLTF